MILIMIVKIMILALYNYTVNKYKAVELLNTHTYAEKHRPHSKVAGEFQN